MNYLSVDVGGTFIKFGLLDHSGNFLERWKKPTPQSLAEFKKVLLLEIQHHETAIKGIAVSCPGRIDSLKGYIYKGGALSFLADFPMKQWLAKYTTVPISLINDGKAAALSEWWIGNLQGVQNGAAIVLGTGVGGGLILNNQLYNGAHFQAGELSFMVQAQTVEDPTQLLGYAGSAVRFIQKATALLGVAEDDYQAVFSSIEKTSSQPVKALFEEYCAFIAQLITNLQAILDIEKVVIGGGISEQDAVIQMIQQKYKALRQQESLLKETLAPLEIEACAYRNSANLLGALYQLLLDMEA